jgi:hypothetical protein
MRDSLLWLVGSYFEVYAYGVSIETVIGKQSSAVEKPRCAFLCWCCSTYTVAMRSGTRCDIVTDDTGKSFLLRCALLSPGSQSVPSRTDDRRLTYEDAKRGTESLKIHQTIQNYIRR